MDIDKRGAKVGLIAVLIILCLVVVLYSKQCGQNSTCFNTYLEKCDKARYVSDLQDATWQYEILGPNGYGKCIVDVKLLVAKEGNVNLAGLEGNEMKCYTDIGSVADPKADLRNCNGLLKEKVQEVIIQRMHTYILDNIGKISAELQKII